MINVKVLEENFFILHTLFAIFISVLEKDWAGKSENGRCLLSGRMPESAKSLRVP